MCVVLRYFLGTGIRSSCTVVPDENLRGENASGFEAWIGVDKLPLHTVTRTLQSTGPIEGEALCLSHVHHAADAVALFHHLEGAVDLVQRLPVGDEFVDLQFAGHVVVHEVGELAASLDPTEGASFPYTAGDELECWLGVVSYLPSMAEDGRLAYGGWRSLGRQRQHR